MVPRTFHYLLSALMWAFPGVIITIKGIKSYCAVEQSQLWWTLLCTISVITFFFSIFHRVTTRYIARISALPEKSYIYETLPLRGWLLILFMMSLGVAMKYVSGVPVQFVALFYSGLGPMLILFSLRFLFAVRRG